ncbi:hypothetical protein AX15_003131 [Amanita polypyramis BW_CC]|nr:hypothetical protein AX15_003131 [Amanita polypyramis BW_CC]
MVFANLQEREKDAFFSLLDEYFQSRPEVFTALSSKGGNNNNSATGIGKSISGYRSALSQAAAVNPAVTSAATGFAKRGFAGVGGFSGGQQQQQQATDASSHEQQDSQSAGGRVAAAAAAFSHQARSIPGISRSSSSSGGASTFGGGGTSNKLGGVDTSSLRNVFAARAGQTASPPSHNKSNFTAPEPEPEEEEAQGEWAEALYDYVSDEPGDLQIRENQQIWVTEKNSDDWWTGEFDGKSGLFPASYVKLL